MVYKNISNGKINSFVVMCDCGCGNGLEFKVTDDEIFVSSVSGDFYTNQGIFCALKEKISYIGKYLVKKPIYMCDCCMNREDVLEFLDTINHIELKELEEDYDFSLKNDSKISMYYEKACDDVDMSIYGIYIKPTMNLSQYLRGKEYRAYEIIYSKKDWKRFVSACNRYFKDKV